MAEDELLKRLRELETRQAVLALRVEELEREEERRKSNWTKFFWTIGGTTLVAFVSWVIGGGLAK